MTAERSFLDTNVIFYAYDSSEPAKQAVAQAVLREKMAAATGVVSCQVLNEFFVATVLKKKRLTSRQADQIIVGLGAMSIVDIDYPMVRAAIAIHEQHQVSYWDALIIASADRADCQEILSEDLNHGQTYGSVRVNNPFLAAR